MKKLVLISAFLSIAITLLAQEVKYKSTTFGVQAGYAGGWINNELHLFDKVVLKSELGVDFGVWESPYSREKEKIAVPVISVEPRYYFRPVGKVQNSESRQPMSGYFFSLKSSYHYRGGSNLIGVSGYEWIENVHDLSISPTAGLKYIVGRYLSCEAGIGIRYKYFFRKHDGYMNNAQSISFCPHLRIGLTF